MLLLWVLLGMRRPVPQVLIERLLVLVFKVQMLMELLMDMILVFLLLLGPYPTLAGSRLIEKRNYPFCTFHSS